MNNKQIARDNANGRASLFLVANDTALKLNILYPPLKTAFNNKMGEMDVAKQKQYEPIAPVTTDKSIHHDALVTGVNFFASKASVQAYNTNNADLAISLDHPVNYLSRANDDDLIGRTTALKTIMNDNLTILTVIAPDDITLMETLISDFKAVKDMPMAEIKEIKAEGTDPIPGLLDDIDVIKHKISKLLYSDFPELYPTWKSEIKVGSPVGARNTSLVVQYFDMGTGAILSKVKATVNNMSESIVKYSTKKGYVRFYSLNTGNYMLTSEHPAYITDIKNNVGVNNTQIVRLNVSMQIIASTGTLDLTVVDAETGNPMNEVLVSIQSIGFTGTTDESGKLIKSGLTAGTYVGTLTAENYQKFDFTFTIASGQSLPIQLALVK